MTMNHHPKTAKNHDGSHDGIRDSIHNGNQDRNADHCDCTSDEESGPSVNLLFDASDSESNKSIDSEKTEDPRYPWDAKAAARAAATNTSRDTPTPNIARPMENYQRKSASVAMPTPMTTPITTSKTATIQESPTTKLLNSFSQNMDDLQYEPCIDKCSDSNDATAAPSPPTRDLPHGCSVDWEIHPIRIVPSTSHTQQGLGVVIARGAFPIPTSEGRQRQTQRPHCLVKRLHEDGMGIRGGLQPGDWFLRPMDANTNTNALPQDDVKFSFNVWENPPKLATFDEIQAWSKESFPRYRPIRVLRRKVTKAPSTTATIPHNATDNTILASAWVDVATKPRSISTPTTATPSVSDKTLAKTASAANMTPSNVSQPPRAEVSFTSSDKHNGSTPPYCVLCNYYNPDHWADSSTHGMRRKRPKRPPRHHHTWCPKHKEFDAERVEKVLARMDHCYRVLGCEACHAEYQTGKVISVKKKKATNSTNNNNISINNNNNNNNTEVMEHNSACLQYQEKLKKEERRKRKQEEEEEQERREEEEEIYERGASSTKRTRAVAKAATTTTRRVESKKRKQGTGKRRATRCDNTRSRADVSANGYISNSNSNSSCGSRSSDEGMGCEDGSIYHPPTRKARMETITYTRKRPYLKVDSNKVVSAPEKKRKSKTSRGHHVHVDEELRQFGGVKPRGKTDSNSGTHGDRSQNIHQDGDEQAKTVWVPLYDDPWGEEGYQTGDVLLFGPQRGMGHYETLLPLNLRYKVNPFGDDSTYRTTHCTPEDGLAVICLKRDPLGRMPWGFEPIRDEFGQACLVHSVDPNSPASAATFLGVPASGMNTSGVSASATTTGSGKLKVNDMIIAINGTPVGGMTKAGLEIELEMSAPNLILTVCRYKHAEKVARKFAEMERNMLDIMDRAARDDRLMGWREIGNGIEPRPRETGAITVAKKVPQSQPQPQSQNLTLNRSTAGEAIRNDEDGALPLHKEITTLENTDLPELKLSKGKNEVDKGSEYAFTNRDQRTTKISIEDKEDQTRGISSTMENLQRKPDADGDSSVTTEDSAAHDENPQMGCICGTKHSSSRIETFWIQCESCNSWYHVAKNCIGFDEQQANCPNFEWHCAACVPDSDSDEDMIHTNNHSDHNGVSQLEETKDNDRQQKNRCTSQRHEKSDQCVDDVNGAKDTAWKLNKNRVNETTDQSLASRQNPSNRVEVGVFTHREVDNSQQVSFKNKPSIATDGSNDVSISAQLLPPTPVHQTISANFSNTSSPLSAEKEPAPKDTYFSEPKPSQDFASEPIPESSSPKGQSEKKHATPPALRQLKSYNNAGLSYWELFESEQIANNPDRELRKRKTTTNKSEQHRKDGGGGKYQALPSKKTKNKKRDYRSSMIEAKERDSGKEKSHTPPKRARIRSIQERVGSKTESNVPSVARTTDSGKPDDEITIPTQTFEEGDLVYVESHAWAYVNNSGGIGKIQKAYISEDGDRVYDVMYPVLMRTEKSIMAEFMSLYSFD